MAGGSAWTKLQGKSTTYSVTLVKHIIGGAQPPASAQVKLVEVDEESAGQRLDNFLIRQLKGVPKTHVYRIIRSGEVRVNKGRAAADTRVAAGDVVRLPPVRISEQVAEKLDKPAPAREFPVLFEDEHLIAIDKPAGVAVHGGSGVSFGVIEQLRQARPGAKFLELVHRLDRETSGILLVAKKRSALLKLQDQFRERETGKTYLALVVGAWPANKKVIDVPLHKYLQADGERRVKVVAKDDPDGMRSITLVKVQGCHCRRARPGRLHSRCWKSPSRPAAPTRSASTWRRRAIRSPATTSTATSSSTRRLQKRGLKRMFLHAWRLQFNHPATGERIELLAALPPELKKFADHAHPPRPRQFDLIAFDWDGTLFDSTRIIVRCIQRAVVDVGGAMPSDKAAAYVIGMGLHAGAGPCGAGRAARRSTRNSALRYRHHYIGAPG